MSPQRKSNNWHFWLVWIPSWTTSSGTALFPISSSSFHSLQQGSSVQNGRENIIPTVRPAKLALQRASQGSKRKLVHCHRKNIIVLYRDNVEVSILHRPRGGKGVWQRVEKGEMLRVTKEKGKRLTLRLQPPLGVLLSSQNGVSDSRSPTTAEAMWSQSVECDNCNVRLVVLDKSNAYQKPNAREFSLEV